MEEGFWNGGHLVLEGIWSKGIFLRAFGKRAFGRGHFVGGQVTPNRISVGVRGWGAGPINESSNTGGNYWIQVEKFDFFILAQNHLESVWEHPRSVLGWVRAFSDSL